MEEMKKQIDDIHKILTGNGSPKDGLVFKVAIVEQHVQFFNKFGWLILTGAVSIPFTILGGFVMFKINH